MNTLTKGLLGLACACLIALGIYLKGYHDSDTKHLLEAQSAALAFNKKQEEEREKSQAALADISKTMARVSGSEVVCGSGDY